MSPVYRAALRALLLLALLSLLAGLAGGPAWGFGLCAGGLAWLLAYHLRHLARLAAWTANPAPGRVPEGSGSWDDVLAALHRYEREATRRQESLADALARFRRAAEALPDGAVILNEANRIEWCNVTAAAQLELDARADLGQPIANLVRDPQFLEYLAAGEFDRHAPVRVRREERLVLELQIIPFGEKQKLLLAHDMTQAERLDTMRQDFVANVSHELRTPLTVLVGFLETVRELKLDPQRVRDYIGMMSEQAARMQHIIEDLLTLSMLDSAPPPPEERVRTKALLARVLADAQALSAGSHEITLTGTPGADLIGSEAELASAFGNLASNAVRYTPAGGRIRLSWHDGANGAEFAVEDNGPGIAAEHLPRLTERFYRVDRSRSRETGGTGLGLAIVKHAAARHQAVLDVQSRPGAGSRFSLRFAPSRSLDIAEDARQP